MSSSLYNPFLFSAFVDRRTFKEDGPSDSGNDDDKPSSQTLSGPPAPTVYENDYSDPKNPKLDTDPSKPGTQVSQIKHSTDNDDSVSTRINSGDTVSQLALDNNTTIEQIKADNPGIDINNIKAGETINITSDTRKDGESIYTGATQTELDAGNAMSNNDDAPPAVPAVTADDVAVADPAQQGDRSDAVDAILVSTHGWTMGPDGDAYSTPEKAAAAGSTYDDLDGALTNIPAPVEKTDYQKKLEAAGESDLSGLDQVAATDVDYTGVTNTNTSASTDTFNDKVVVPKPVSETVVDYDTTGSGNNFTEAATSDTGESLTDFTEVVTDDTEYETYNGETVKVKYLNTGIYADNPIKYYTGLDGGWIANAPRETAANTDFTEIDDGGGTNFSVVPGDARDDVYFDLSDSSEPLVTENGVNFTGTYDGVTYTDGAEVKDPLKIDINLGDDIGTSIEEAVTASELLNDNIDATATTDPIGGYSSLTQKEFIKEADAVIPTSPTQTDYPIAPFSDMSPELAEVLGLSDIYKPGDMVLPQDLELLKDAGYTVVEEPSSTYGPSYDAFGDEYDTAEEAAQADIKMGIGETSSYTPTIASTDAGSRPGYAGYKPNQFLADAGSDVRVDSGSDVGIKEMTETLKGGSELTLGEIALGLGFDTAEGFMQELALRVQGTGQMADDALNLLVEVNMLRGSETYINPEYAENLKNLDEMNALDRMALEKEALDKGVSVASLLDPLVSAESGAAIPISLSRGEYSVASDALDGAVKGLKAAEKYAFEQKPEAYKEAVRLGMPNPDNEGYNMAGEPITPGLWMASVAAQELLGLGMDVLAVVALGPVIGTAVVAQQGVAEAGQAAADEVVEEMKKLKAQGAFDNMSEEDYQEMVSGAEKQAFYTSGIAGGAVDTLTALTAGGFAPLAKALPNALRSGLIAAGVVTAEGISGSLEQIGVNAAVIKALKDQGIDPADYDKEMLDKVLTAAIYEVVGGSTSGAAAGVGSYVSNLSSKNVTSSEDPLDAFGGSGSVNKEDPLDAFGGPGESLLNEMNKEGSNISVVGNNEKNANGSYDEYTLIDNNTGKTETVSAADFKTSQEKLEDPLDAFGGPGESLLNEMNKEGSNISVVGNNEKNAKGGYDQYTLIDNNTGKTETVSAADFNTSQEGASGAVAGGVGGAGKKKTQLLLGGTSVEVVTTRTGEQVEVVTITDGNGSTTVKIGDTTQIVSGGENVVVTDPKTGVSVNVNATNTTEITSTAGLVNEIAAETNTDPTTLLSGSTVNVSVADPFAEVVADPFTEVVADPVTEVVTDPATEVLTNSLIDADEPVTPYTSFTPDPVTPPTSYTPDSGPAPVGENAVRYTSGIAGAGGFRPTVAPRYQSRSVGQYTPYRPESGVTKIPTGPAPVAPSTYLAETVQGGMRYGNPYILPNADPRILAQLAMLQGTGDAMLPAEYLLNDEDLE